MKKIVAFSIVFTLLAVTVFAEFTVTGGAAMTFIPIGAVTPDGEDAEIGAGFGRNGAANAEIAVNLKGASENGKAGFRLDWRPKMKNGSFTGISDIGDYASLWVKPVDWVRLEAGRFLNNDIRGRMGSGHWFGDLTIPRPGEGSIFSNFDTKAGFMAVLTPPMVDGLGIYVAVKDIDPAASDSITNYDDTRGVSRGIGYVYENTQAAVSYAIPNIGLARVQYVGAHPGVNFDNTKLLPSAIAGISAPSIQAAFAFTGVPNLTVDVGGKFFLPVEDPKPEAAFLGPSTAELPGTFKAPIEVGLGVQYAAGSLTAIFIVDGKFAGSAETALIDPNDPVELGMELRPWLTVRYKLNDTFTVQGEGGVIYAGDSEVDGNVVAAGGMRYGFGAGVQIDFVSTPNCRLRAGVTYAGGEGANFGNPDDGKKLNGVFNVPLAFSVEF